MKKIRLEIKSIQYSNSQSGAYVIILDDISRSRRLPIVIGGFEARSIAFKLERIQPTRPLTHDIFKSFSDSFGINLKEVTICKFEEGIFYSKMTFVQGDNVQEIDARTSDAIALSLRFDTPIYIHEDILDQAGIEIIEDSSSETAEHEVEEDASKGEFHKYTVKELQELLEQSISDEEYEKASRIRDEITKRNQA